MGADQSTRKVIVEGTDNIRITESVVGRLIGVPESEVSKGSEGQYGPVTAEEREAIKRQIEDEYRQKIYNANVELNRIKTEQFAKAVQEVESKFLKYSGSPVCQDLQDEVFQCYQKNPSEPLNCSKQVKAFTSAVEKARLNASLARQDIKT